jgi:hypothetical protein
MASGVNTTFRQIGIATGIAVYGSLFASTLREKMDHALSGISALDQHLPKLIAAIRQGNIESAIDAAPASVRGELVAAVRSSFAGTLDVLLVVSAGLALVGALGAVVLVRSRDFVATNDHRPESTPEFREPVASSA